MTVTRKAGAVHHLHARLRRQLLRVLGDADGREHHQVRVTALEQELLGARRRDHALDDLGGVVARPSPPVVREVVEDDLLALLPPGQAIRAGPVAARREERRAAVRIGQVRLPGDEHLGEPVEQRDRRLRGHQADGHRVDDLDLLERRQEEGAAAVDRLGPVDGRLHRLGVERRSVVELHVRAQLELDRRAVGCDLPRLRQRRRELGRGAPGTPAGPRRAGAARGTRGPPPRWPGRPSEARRGSRR